MKKRTSKTTVYVAGREFPAKIGSRNRALFDEVGNATTKDGREYTLFIHRRKRFPAILDTRSDVMAELTWDFLVTIAHESLFTSISESGR